MGKYTLLLVLSAILGGSMLTLNMRRAAGLTGRDRAEGQASLIARQIAESGQGVALASAVGDAGFLTEKAFFAKFGTTPQAYNGGAFRADSFRSYSAGRRADLVVSGFYGPAPGTQHVLSSSYEFDPMDYPGPIWLDVPYATASGAPAKVSDNALIASQNVTLSSYFDRTKFNELAGLLKFETMRSDLQSAMGGASIGFPTALKNVSKNPALGKGGVLDDLNIENAEDLYQTALGVKTPSDRTIVPPVPGGTKTITSSETWDGATTITHVDGSLTVGKGGRIDGEGMLVVSGGLVVTDDGRLDWEGLVLVRSDEDSLPVTLQGNTKIRGGLVINQEAVAQVGHLDVTVLKAPAGFGSPAWGLTGPSYGPSFPFYEHTHKFDDLPSVGLASGTRMVRFVNDGAGSLSQDANLLFQQTLDGLGSDDVQLRIRNAGRHGHGFLRLKLEGEPLAEGPVRSGFPSSVASGWAFGSRTFRADELEALTLDVRSLPSLKRLFDTEPGCSSPWPICVGYDANRRGALTLQLVHKGRTVYEAVLYWHVNEGDEWNDHLAELAAWEADVVANGTFGTQLDLSGADIAVDLPPIVRLSDRLGFAGNRVLHLGTSVQHVSAAEARGGGGGGKGGKGGKR